MIHDYDSNNFISELKSIIIKHSFLGQILINASEQHILINVYTIDYKMICNYNQSLEGRFELELLFLVISIK